MVDGRRETRRERRLLGELSRTTGEVNRAVQQWGWIVILVS